jgi:regulator of cell morphogenesis and NO signaling
MNLQTEKTVAEIVAGDYRTADVFKNFGIDFCCGGKVSLSEICRKKDLDFEVLKTALEKLNQTALPEELQFSTWEPGRLIDHILEKHHSYVNRNLDLITQYAEKVALVHGEHRPEVKTIARLFKAVAEELTTHMQKEERTLFPFIKKMAEARKENTLAPEAPFGTVGNPIRMMENEHESAGELLHEIARLSDNYNPPEEACNTYRVLYAKLQEFENDLHEHIHLENNVLFPMALALETPVICSLAD